MDCLEVIHTRRSIRKFTDEPISQENVESLLRAAMASPTAVNSQSWRFLVIDDKEILQSIPHIHPYAAFAAHAPLAIVVCGDTQASHASAFWSQNGAAAIQTMMLAGRALGIGSVWCAIHPSEEREEAFSKTFGLPDHIRPLGLVVLGHPDQPFRREDRFDETKVHHNHW